MKMLDKERRRKKIHAKDGHGTNDNGGNDRHTKTNNGFNNKTSACDVVQATSYETMSDKGIDHDDSNLANKKRQKSSQISNSSKHTEIRTDDFVVRLLYQFNLYQFSTIQKKNMQTNKPHQKIS